MLLMIDNYDSFTYNLVQMFRQYDLAIEVRRSDRISLDEVADKRPDYLVISPGPKAPPQAGISKPLIQRFFRQIPILGVCLGMQCISEVFGGRTLRCPQPVHGKTSLVHHHGQGILAGLPSPFRAARYHSLMVEPDQKALADELVITARTEDGRIMGLSHQRRPLHGVQFHPESFMTECGFALVENFLKLGPLRRCFPAESSGSGFQSAEPLSRT